MPEFCWQQEKFDIDVQEEDSREYQFIQTGYAMPYESTHTFDISIKKGVSGQVDTKRIDRTKGGKLCLDQRGSYTLVPQSCYRFDQEKFTFETSQAQISPLVFKPTSLKVEGKVLIKDDTQASKIVINILDSTADGAKIDTVQPKKINGENSLSFEYYSPVDQSFVIEPQLLDDGNLLFYPQRKQISVGGECITNIVFETKTGYVVTGRVEPATEDVAIKVTNKKTLQEVTSVFTDAQGNYKVGPLYDDQEYDIEPFKEDYIFKKDGAHNFKAQKLSTLTVHVKDSNGAVLEQVSLQLSAGKGFRLTGTTNQNGEFKFIGLNGGKFYLTAIIKEYEFEQSSTLVELQEGDHTVKILVAKRVAYSAFGQVSKINGLPLSEGRVIAKCDSCDRVEETKLEADGQFRIRGLVPNQKYSLTVISNELERTVPGHLSVEVSTDDSKNNNIIAIMQSPFIEVSGSVDFENED